MHAAQPYEPEPIHIGVMCLHSELCSPILSAVRKAGMWPERLESVEHMLSQIPMPEIMVIYSGNISPELLELVADATSPPAPRLLVVSWDRDPQRIADLLRTGADDYLHVPFAVEELIARILAVTSRSGSHVDERPGQKMVFDFSTRSIITGRKHASLSAQEWNVLIALLDAEGRTVSVNELSQSLPGNPNPGAIIAILSRLRGKFKSQGFDAINIETVRGSGYVARFERNYNSLALT